MLGIFLDTETSGLNPLKHRVIEIAFKIIDIESGEELEVLSSIVKLSKHEWDESDPESLKINGFTFEEIQRGKDVLQIKEMILHLFEKHHIERGKAVFICQNPSFDRAFFHQIISPEDQEMLNWPYHWLDLASMYWTKALLTKQTPPWITGVSKDKIAASLKLPPEEKPHRALNGVNHLVLCYEAVVGFTH